METARSLIYRMQDREQALLQTRTETLNRFAAATPLLILLASVLAVIVTWCRS